MTQSYFSLLSLCSLNPLTALVLFWGKKEVKLNFVPLTAGLNVKMTKRICYLYASQEIPQIHQIFTPSFIERIIPHLSNSQVLLGGCSYTLGDASSPRLHLFFAKIS